MSSYTENNKVTSEGTNSTNHVIEPFEKRQGWVIIASVLASLCVLIIIISAIVIYALWKKYVKQKKYTVEDLMEKSEKDQNTDSQSGFLRDNASIFWNEQYYNTKETINTISFSYSEGSLNTNKLYASNRPSYLDIKNDTTVYLEGDQTVVNVFKRTGSDVWKSRNFRPMVERGYRTIDGSYNRSRNNRFLSGIEKKDYLEKDLKIIPFVENLTERIFGFKGLQISVEQHSDKTRARLSQDQNNKQLSKCVDEHLEGESTDSVLKGKSAHVVSHDSIGAVTEGASTHKVSIHPIPEHVHVISEDTHTTSEGDHTTSELGQASTMSKDESVSSISESKTDFAVPDKDTITEAEYVCSSTDNYQTENNGNQAEDIVEIECSPTTPSKNDSNKTDHATTNPIGEQEVVNNINIHKQDHDENSKNWTTNTKNLISKDVKIDNLNIQGNNENNYHNSEQSNNMPACHISQSQPLVNSLTLNQKQFRYDGGQWSEPNSDVHLKISAGAIPKNATCDIYREVHTDLALYQRFLRQDECFTSPIPEFHCSGLKKFEKHVTIEVPHCLTLETHWQYIRVQYGDTKNNVPFRDAVRSPEENNIKPDVYFTVGPKYIIIYTTHFTEFLCSSSHGIAGFSSFHTLQLEALVFARYSSNGEQEIQLRVYVIDTLHQILDMKHGLVKQQREEQFHLKQSYSVKSPEIIFPETQVTMLLQPQDSKWAPICGTDGTPHSELVQSRAAKDVILCQEKKYNPSTIAEYVLVFKAKEQRASYFKGNLKMLIRQTEEPEKRSKRWYQRWRSSTTDSQPKVLEFETNMWINFSLNCEVPEIVIDVNFDDLSEVFDYISRCLQQEHIRPLVRKLGYTTADWQAIEESYPKLLREQKYQLLEKYRQKTGPEFNLPMILNFLEGEGLYKMANTIKDKCTFSY